MKALENSPRNLFFTGKGGVGKTSVASAMALALSERGARVLLVSTDPASNLDEVLGTRLSGTPTAILGAERWWALNIDPEASARAYRDRVVGPYRGVLPAAAVRSIEEQLSGACTVEIAAFDEFSKLMAGGVETASRFDHVVFDTAPTGHTLRLLALPAAWTTFFEANVGGTSCLGPLAGLKAQQALYEKARASLVEPAETALVLVARPDRAALAEAERTRRELALLGMKRHELVLNGLMPEETSVDPVASAMRRRQREALAGMAPSLAQLPRTSLELLPTGLVGLDMLRRLLSAKAPPPSIPAARGTTTPPMNAPSSLAGLSDLMPALEAGGRGVIMTMGKGGVGKTAVAVAVARALAGRGHAVHLTTTDPAGNVADLAGAPFGALRVSRIDAQEETRAYAAEVMRSAGENLDEAGRALLEEDLRSPCTEEIAVFRAFARLVSEGDDGFVVIDTAPTGHTLLLLDAAESYHREVLRTSGSAPEEVRSLMKRLVDGAFTRILLVTLPEATPVHEAAALQDDLARAGIHPLAWVINQSLLPLSVTDPLLVERRAQEGRFHAEVGALAKRVVVLPWREDGGGGAHGAKA